METPLDLQLCINARIVFVYTPWTFERGGTHLIVLTRGIHGSDQWDPWKLSKQFPASFHARERSTVPVGLSIKRERDRRLLNIRRESR